MAKRILIRRQQDLCGLPCGTSSPALEAMARTAQSRDVVLPCDARPGKDGDRMRAGCNPGPDGYNQSSDTRDISGRRRSTRAPGCDVLAGGSGHPCLSIDPRPPSILAAIKEAMLDANPGADAASPSLRMTGAKTLGTRQEPR